jgi:hypothetical protein
MAVFWVVASCSLVEVYLRFRGARNAGKRLPDYMAQQPRRHSFYLLHINMGVGWAGKWISEGFKSFFSGACYSLGQEHFITIG